MTEKSEKKSAADNFDTFEDNFQMFFAEQYGAGKSDDEIKIDSLDSEYTVDKVQLELIKDSRSVEDKTAEFMTTTLVLKHVRNNQRDDHAEVKVCFDRQGTLTTIKPKVSYGGDDLVKVLDYAGMAIKKVESVAEKATFVIGEAVAFMTFVAGVLGSIPSEGASDVAAVVVLGKEELAIAKAELAETIIFTSLNGALVIMEGFLKAMIDISDDGGRAHFPQVVAHAVMRAQVAAMETYASERFRAGYKLSPKDFQASIIALGKSSSHFGVKDESCKSGKAVEYTSHGEKFRSWIPDLSVAYDNKFVLMSIKIDGMVDNEKDDHALLLIAVEPSSKKVMVAQCVITMHEHDSVYIGPIVYDANGKVANCPVGKGKLEAVESGQTIEDAMHDQIKDAMHDHNDQRKQLANVVRDNIGFMIAGIDRS